MSETGQLTEEEVTQKPLLPLWAAVIVAATAGVLMDMASPALGLWPLAFIAVALVLLSVIGRSLPAAALLGLVYGVLYYGLLISWTSRYLGPLPWVALTAAEAAITAVLFVPLALAYRWLPRAFPGLVARLLVLPLLLAALWLLRELVLGSWPYGGFPWARLGMTQSESPLASLSSWLGVSGLSLVMVALIAAGIEIVRSGCWRYPMTLAVPLLLIGGFVVLPAYPTTVVGTMTIAAVQGNGPTGYFDAREPYAVIQAQSDASAPLIGQNLDLVVWPEGSLDYDPFRSAETARRLSLESSRLGAPLLANAAVTTPSGIYNTSLLWGSDIGVQSHAKRHPVPFGEYIPDRAFFRLLVPDLVDLVEREYSPGQDPPLMTVGDATLGLAICFDVIYDDVIREGILGGAEVLVFQTNNADFRGTDENLQQLAFARMRAIETGRWVVNVSTVGTSQIIAHDGTTVASLDSDTAGALVELVERRVGITAGILLGPWIEALALLGGIAFLITCGFAARRRA